MIYAQFYQKSAISDEIIEACSDRAVIILDGRQTIFTHRQIAKEECIKRKYIGFAIFKGNSFLDSKQIDERFMVNRS